MMWPYTIRLNPIGIIILLLLFFTLYLIYSSTSYTSSLYKSYEEQNIVSRLRLKHGKEENVHMQEIHHVGNDPLKDEYIKQELKLFEMVNLLDLLNVAIQVAQHGGNQVRRVKELSNYKKKDKGINDPLTEGDLRSHRVMVSQFSTAFPGINIISEEENSKIDGVEEFPMSFIDKKKIIDEVKHLPFSRYVALSEITVWIDPLDATKEYTENLLKYVTTMVCVAYKGLPLIGVIHKPFQKNTEIGYNNTKTSYETYWAWDKVGYSENIKKIVKTRKKKADDTNLRVIVSRSHTGSVKNLSEHLFKKPKIIEAGGSGYKTIEVLKGNADVYLHNSLIKKWDICAPNAIINSVSRDFKTIFTTLKKEDIKYNDDKVKNLDGLLASIGVELQKTV